MRTSYLTLIATAAMIMAACSNESVLREIRDNSQPTAITFSSYSEKSTKADNGDDTNILNLEYFHKSFAVYGTKQSINDLTEISYVFGADASTAAGVKNGTVCTYTANNDASFYGSNWSYEDPRYWDNQANHQFVAYAPALASNPLRYEYAAAGALVGAAGNDFVATDYVLTGKNLQSTPSSTLKNQGFNVNNQDLDLMTSDVATQAGTNHGQVQLTFRHILAKLNIIIGKTASFNNSTITIDSIKITGLHDKGSYKESLYDISTPVDVSGWIVAATNNDPNYTLYYKVTEQIHPELPDADINPDKVNPLCFIESLVIPQTIADDAKITLKYNIVTNNNAPQYFTYEATLKDIFTTFFDRKSYTITFTVDPSVITFDAGVAAWADQNYGLSLKP